MRGRTARGREAGGGVSPANRASMMPKASREEVCGRVVTVNMARSLKVDRSRGVVFGRSVAAALHAIQDADVRARFKAEPCAKFRAFRHLLWHGVLQGVC